MIRQATLEDAPDILELYKKVASAHPNNLTLQVNELTLTYVQKILQEASLRGLALLMFENNKLIGFMKGYTSEFCRQAHVLTNCTLMIEPSGIGQGHANKICDAYRDEILGSMHHIRLIEIVPHCSNIHAIRLYEKLGFVRQAALPNKIRYVDGTFDNEIVMQWTNPNFCEQSLLRYHEYLQKLINDTQSPSLKS